MGSTTHYRFAMSNGLGQVMQGDLGFRFKNGDDVAEVLVVRLQRTFTLMGTALAIGIFVGVTLGIFIGLRQYSFWDFTFTGLSFVGISMPAFIAGIFGLYIFFGEVGLVFLPVACAQSASRNRFFDLLYHLVLPAGTLAIFNLATFMRYTRFSMLEVKGGGLCTHGQCKGAEDANCDLAPHFSERAPPRRYSCRPEFACLGCRRTLHGDNL